MIAQLAVLLLLLFLACLARREGFSFRRDDSGSLSHPSYFMETWERLGRGRRDKPFSRRGDFLHHATRGLCRAGRITEVSPESVRICHWRGHVS